MMKDSNYNNIHNLTEAIEWFSDLSEGKNISVFTGAGISLSSGLPLASRLIDHILHSISDINTQIVEDPLSYLPFEGYIEQMIIDSDDETIMQLFTNESFSPNINHRLMAHLYKLGVIARIYTVNFDILHELAFNELDIKCNKIYRDENFTSESYNDNAINLIKLHGCGSDIESMKFVLSSVTNRENRIQRENLTKLLFGNPNEVIVIFGYSANDNFDIIPAINTIKENKATVIYINHTEGAEQSVDIIRNTDRQDDYKFSKYPGFFISADTTNFIEKWGKHYNIIIDRESNHSTSICWTSFIKQFIQSLKDVRYKFLGTICNQAGLLQDAKMYFEKDVKQNQRAYSYQQLAQIALITNDRFNYATNINLAKEIAERENDTYTYIGCLFNEAEFNIQVDNLSSALDLYLEAYMLASMNFLFYQTRMALKGLTYVYAEKKDYKRAKLFGSLVIELNNSDDNLREKSDGYINYAEILRKLGDLKSAINFIDMAIALKHNLHDSISLINALLTKANILKDNHELIEAKRLFDEAYNTAIKGGVKEIIGKILHQRASLSLIDSELNTENLKDAYESYIFYEKAKNIRYSLSALELLQNMIMRLIYNFFKRSGTIENTDYRKYLRPFDLMKFREVSELSFSWELLDKWIREITIIVLNNPYTFQLLESGRKYLENTLEREITIIRNTNDLVLYNNTIQEWKKKGIIEIAPN